MLAMFGNPMEVTILAVVGLLMLGAFVGAIVLVVRVARRT